VLVKDPQARPSAAKLLTHPFVVGATPDALRALLSSSEAAATATAAAAGGGGGTCSASSHSQHQPSDADAIAGGTISAASGMGNIFSL